MYFISLPHKLKQISQVHPALGGVPPLGGNIYVTIFANTLLKTVDFF
ncbi:MAG: hypothetical protein ACFE9L_19110 [Candidatus Hodarchaeota archaeon]